MPRRDARSVGELLHEADRLSRELLWDVRGDDAASLVRTWGEVVEAAAELWAAIPTVRNAGAGTDSMDRLETLARAMQRSRIKGKWPGEGPTDERAQLIAETISRAADLVTRFGQDTPVHRPEVRADADAARMRLMHILYAGSHGVGLAMHQFNRGVRAQDPEGSRRRPLDSKRHPYTLARTAPWIRRFEVLEHLAGDYIAGRYREALRGEVTTTPDEPDRLRDSLAAWDIQAHRVLASSPAPADILLVCRTQALIATASAVLLVAAAETDASQDPAQSARVLVAVDRSQEAWTHLAGRWSDLVVPGSRTHKELVRAASEFRGALKEAALGTTGWEPAPVIAARIDLPGAAQSMRQALCASVEVAVLIGDHAEATDLQGPARSLSVRAQTEHEAAIDAHRRPDEDVIWVPPRDVQLNRIVPVPDPVRESLLIAAKRCGGAADDAMSAALVVVEGSDAVHAHTALPVDNRLGAPVLPHAGGGPQPVPSR